MKKTFLIIFLSNNIFAGIGLTINNTLPIPVSIIRNDSGMFTVDKASRQGISLPSADSTFFVMPLNRNVKLLNAIQLPSNCNSAVFTIRGDATNATGTVCDKTYNLFNS